MRNHARDRSHAREVKFVASEEDCPFCKSALWIVETRVRHVQMLDELVRLELKGKKCSSPSCEHAMLRYRPPEEGRLVLKAHEFGLDVAILAGEQHLRENVSIPRIHKLLRQERGVPICERSVGNLIDDYVALCECVAGDTDRLRTRLKGQGAIVLSVDGVQYDDRSPVLYVQREVLSGEVLYAERRLARAADDLVPMLERTRDLARDIGVPIIGIVSDKERSLVPAIARVFPGVPHEYCQQHYLGNLAKPLKEDNQRLEEASRDVVTALRDVRRTVERRSAAGRPSDPARPPEGSREPAPSLAVGPASSSPDLVTDSSSEAPTTGLPDRDPQSGPPPLATPLPALFDPATRGDSAPTSAGSTPPVPAASDDAAVADALALAGTTVGAVSGRATLDPPGLKRFQRLQEVRTAAEQAAKKRGLRPADGL